MSNYIKNTKNILKSFNQNVVKPQIAELDGKLVQLGTDVDGKLGQLKGYVDGQDQLLDAKVVALGEKVDGHVQALEGSIQGLDTKVDGHVQTLEGQIGALDNKVDGAVATINGAISGLDTRVSVNETDIANLKAGLSNKNNNTLVVETRDQLPTEGMKTGDLVFVISEKRVYIYKSEVEGFVVLDELTNELDLVDYAKIAYVDGKIAEVNGTIEAVKGELEAECSLKATKVELSDAVLDLNQKIDGLVINGGDTTAELEAVKVRVTANEGAIANHEARVAELERALTEEEIAEIIAFVIA